MLKPQYRLKKRTAFAATYRTGLSYYKDGITMFCGKENKYHCETKFGFVVSKKIHKRAVKRNRIKRLMRESLRLYIKEFGVSNKFMSVIFVASTKILNKKFSDVDEIMKKLVRYL